MRRLLLALTLVPVLVGMAVLPSSGQTKPNVVLIVMDDVGYGDYGAYGAPDIRTPSVARPARAGVKFTDFSAAPACTPTRVALMTGRYYQRTALEVPLGAAPAGGRGLEANGRTLPQLMKNAGYATGLIGKWHLGYRPDQIPNANGFDDF